MRTDELTMDLRDWIEQQADPSTRIRYADGGWNELIFTAENGLKFIITVEEM